MKLLKLIAGVLLTLTLVLAPPIVLEKSSYRFTELLEESYEFTWTKNPYGGPVKNYASGEEADSFHFTEKKVHWDLAGEVVLTWEDNNVLPWAYWYTPRGGYWLTAVVKKDGFALPLGFHPSEAAAKVSLILFHGKATGRFKFKNMPIIPKARQTSHTQTQEMCTCGCNRPIDQCEPWCHVAHPII